MSMDSEHKAIKELGDYDAALERVKTYSEAKFQEWLSTRLNAALDRYESATISADLMEDKVLSGMVKLEIQLSATVAYLDAHSWTAINKRLLDKNDLLELHDLQKLIRTESDKQMEMLMAYMEIKAKDRDPSSAASRFNRHCKESQALLIKQCVLFIQWGLETDYCQDRDTTTSHIQYPPCTKCKGFGAVVRP